MCHIRNKQELSHCHHIHIPSFYITAHQIAVHRSLHLEHPPAVLEVLQDLLHHLALPAVQPAMRTMPKLRRSMIFIC